MSRNTGTFNFAANFEGLLKAPIDAKQLVGTYADLTLPGTWNASGSVWLYDGAIVAVASGVGKGVYWLCDANNYTMTSSWVKAGSGSGAGTLTGATNGLHLAGISGTSVALGGNLTSGTTINGLGLHSLNLTNLNGFLVSTTGGSVSLSTSPLEGLIYGGNYSSSNPYWIPTKLYVDGIAIGLNVHTAAFVATTSGITLSGLTTIDGIATTTGMRVLVKNQVNQIYNGIYSASTGTWGRTADYDFSPSSEISNGDLIPVTSGLTQYNSLWALTSANPVLSGNTLIFTLFSMPTDFIAGTGIAINLNTISLDAMAQAVRLNAITGVTNCGAGQTVCNGAITNHNLCLSTIKGSGGTTVQKIGSEIIVCSNTTSGGQQYSGQTPSAVNLCGITIGYQLTGKTVSCILQDLLVPELFQTSVGTPSTSVGLTYTGTFEVGCVLSQTVTPTYTAGAITPLYLSTSPFTRGGAANAYSYTGPSLTPSGFVANTSCGPFSHTVINGSSTWGVCTRYNVGSTIKGSKGTNNPSVSPNPLPSGNTTAGSNSLTGIYPYYYGKLTSGGRPPVTNALVTGGTKVVAGSTGTVTVSFSSSASEYTWLAIPSTSTSKTCWYVNALDNGRVNNAPSDKYPDQCLISITSGQGCWTSINYKVYMSGAVGAIAAPMEFRNS